MPDKPQKPCKKIGCNALTRNGYCDKHKPTPQLDNRPSSHERGYTYRWRKSSKAYLAKYPWCAECKRNGKATLATEVDHITPHKGNEGLFWDEDNWQGLCHRCHSRKTAQEDGGFGNRSIMRCKSESKVPPLPPKVQYAGGDTG